MVNTNSTEQIFHSEKLSLATLREIWESDLALSWDATARERVRQGRAYLEEKMARADHPIYGINTGFGSLYNLSIEGSDLAQLQTNLVRSHACGTGEVLDPRLVGLMLLLKARSLALGFSGVRPQVIDQLLAFYNRGIYPRVYEQGSLGASGDLAPLAHLARGLMGEGEVWYRGEWQDAAKVLAQEELEPLQLQSKEGLALLNGTQFMLALGIDSYFQAQDMDYQADLLAALSLDAYDGRPEPFDARLHELRPHPGQIRTAQRIREILEGSALLHRPKEHVQDPYSFRCVPQVHGASKDVLSYVGTVLERELNSVTDNPTVFPDSDAILSGGNFHGQPLALALDHLSLALAELGSISERRTYLLVGGQRGLPPFLVARPGLNSGLMIPQYTAASLVSQNKQLCVPATADSITSSNGQEDHVSMGANAATKLRRVVNNLRGIQAIELLTASQALHFREGSTSTFLAHLLDLYREEVPFIAEDRYLSADIERSRQFLAQLHIDAELFGEGEGPAQM